MTATVIDFAAFRQERLLVAIEALNEAAPQPLTDLFTEVEAEAVTKAVDFVVGKTYFCRSACDYDTVFRYTVTKRTAKRLTLVDAHGRVSVRGVFIDHEGGEACYPQGTYSMCPVIRAAKWED